MFEKEMMISGLKKSSQTLAKLVEEMEDSAGLSAQDLGYYRAMMRTIESSLRRIRKIDETALVSPFFERT